LGGGRKVIDPVEEVRKGRGWIAVYGVGYVGLSLVAVYLRKGYRVIGVDIDEEKLKAIREGRLYYHEEVIRDAVRKGLEEGRLKLTTDGVEASKRSVIKTVTVPVYIDWDTKEYSFHALIDVSEKIAGGLKKGDLVIIESSVPPGTTSEVVKPVLEEKSGLRVEEDFYLAYSPERVYIGRAVEDIEENYPKVIGGIGPKSLYYASKFYRDIAVKGVIEMSSTTAAEFEKLAEGVYRDLNIALANELALAAMRLGIDYYEVRRAANSQPYCHLHLPGPGVGGYCIPIYPYFMAKKLLRLGYPMQLTMLGRRINEDMPVIVASMVSSMTRRRGIDPGRIKIAVLGVAFRGDIDDTRLSPSHDVIALLKVRGLKNIVAHDPYVKNDPRLKELDVGLTSNLDKALKDADIVVVLTRHSMYKGLKISTIIEKTGRKPLVFDTVAYLEDDIGYDKLVVLGKG
jgi:nucleotide sugar dehydrogenase